MTRDNTEERANDSAQAQQSVTVSIRNFFLIGNNISPSSPEFPLYLRRAIKFFTVIQFITTLSLWGILSPTSSIIASIVLLPYCLFCALMITGHIQVDWLHLKDKKRKNQLNLTSNIIIPLNLLLGIGGVFLLNEAGVMFLPQILLWLCIIGFSTGVVGQNNIIHTVTHLFSMFLPINFVLVSTMEWQYIGASVLLHLLILIRIYSTILINHLMFGTHERYSETKQQKKRIEKRFSGLLGTTSDWGWESDNHHQITYLSENFERITGLRCDAATSKQNSSQIFLDQYGLDNASYLTLKETLDEKLPFENCELFIENEEAEKKWFSLKGAPEFHPDGEFIGYRGWAHDITHIIRARNKLKKYNEALEHKVIQRTKKLEEHSEQLSLTAQKAEQANIAKTEFIRNMSHKFRTPVNVILGYNKMLANMDSDNSNLNMITEEIANASYKLLRQINNVLYIAHLENMVDDSVCDVIAVDDLVDSALHRIDEQAQQKQVNIICSDLSGMQIYANFQSLEKALSELILNAVSFSPDNQDIHIKTYSDDKNINISIIDSGPGVPPHIIENIDSFFHIGAAKVHTKADEGVGLGIAIASKIAKTHGGTLSLTKTNTHSGCNATIHLPRTRMFERKAS